MPTPIICLDSRVRHFAYAFRHAFSKPQWQHFLTLLLGLLLTLELRNLTGLRRAVAADVSLAALSRFINLAPWSHQCLADTWLLRFRRQLTPLVQAERARRRRAAPSRRGRLPKAVVTGYLIGDDSTMHKPKAKKMQALGRHYSTIAGKPVLGHCLVGGLYLLLERRVPLEPRLYRTKQVAAAEGVEFRDKLQLMVALISEFEPVPDTLTHVVLDSWYANGKLWRAAKQRKFQITCGLKSNRCIKVADPQAPKGHRWVRLPEYAAGLGAGDYEFVARPTQQGGGVFVHLLKTHVRKLGKCQVAILRQSLDAPLEQARYWATSDEEADATAVVQHISARWNIEVLFGDCKELLGLDHYQLLSAAGLLRWWTLVMTAYVLLEEQRAELCTQLEQPVTIGEARRELQRVHRGHLLRWLHEQFEQGATPEQVSELLAA